MFLFERGWWSAAVLAVLVGCGGTDGTETPAPDAVEDGPPAQGTPDGGETPAGDPSIDGNGAFRWIFADTAHRSFVSASDTDAEGNLYVFVQTVEGEYNPPNVLPVIDELQKFSPSGERLFRKQLATTWTSASLGVSPAGDIYVQITGNADVDGKGPVDERTNVLAKLTPEGDFVWKRVLPNPPPAEDGYVIVNDQRIVDVSPSGRVALLTPNNGATAPSLEVFAPDSQVLWQKPVADAEAATFDSEENIILGLGGTTRAGLQKRDPQGEPQWETPLVLTSTPEGTPRTSVQMQSVQVTQRGTVVATARYLGKVRWGPFQLAEPDQGLPPYDHPNELNTVFFAAESTGAARFATVLESEYFVSLPVDPAGRAYLATSEALHKYDLEGNPIWSKDFTAFVTALHATPDHGLTVTGNFSAPTDFGSGTLSPVEDGSALAVHYGP